jgi:hypothetical protein
MSNIRGRLMKLEGVAANRPRSPIAWDALAAGDWDAFAASLPDPPSTDAPDGADVLEQVIADVARNKEKR